MTAPGHPGVQSIVSLIGGIIVSSVPSRAGAVAGRLVRVRRLAVAAAACIASAVIPVATGGDIARTVGNTSFDLGSGASTYVSIADSPALRLSDNFTIEAWVYLRDSGNETIIDKGPVYSYLFQIYPNGQSGLGLYAGYGGSYQWVYSSAVTLPQNQWNHVAVTFTNGANGLKFYANGNLVSQHTPAGALISSNGDVNLGRQEPGGCNCNLLQGRLDEVRIWSTARSQAELQSTMAIAPASDTSGLVAYWDFNDGAGSTVANRTSGSGMNGTIVNFPGNSPWVSGVPRVASGPSNSGLGSALANFVWGPSSQSSSNTWQYFEIPDDLSSATLLADWQRTGNEVVGHQNQWDNNRVNGSYPFVQYIQSPTSSAFGGDAKLMLHADNSNKRSALGWKNTTGATLTVDVDASLKFAYPSNNTDGATFALHRGLSGTPRYSLVTSGTLPSQSSSTFTIDESVQLQAGELVYLSVGNNGQYFWDHTIVDMSVNVAVPSVTAAPTVSGTAAPGQTLNATNGTWTGSPSTHAFQWKRASTVSGVYSDVVGANSNSYTLTGADVGYFFKVSVVASNVGGNSAPALSAATGLVSVPTTTTTTTTTTTAATTTVAPAVSTTSTVVASGSTVAPDPGLTVTATTLAGQSGVPRTTTPTFAPGSLTAVASTTTVAPTTTTTTTVPAPVVGQVEAGAAEVRIGDSTEPVTVRREENRLVVSAGDLTASVAALDGDGAVAALDENGNVRLAAGGRIRIELDGFAAGAGVEAWLFSDPVRLGTATTSSTGTLSEVFVVPVDVEDGEHRVAVVAGDGSGETVTVTVGVMVGQWDSGPGIAVWLIVVPIVLAVLGALVIPATRRRRRTAGT